MEDRRTIENRSDVHELVSAFYTKVRADELIGDFFNTRIKDDEWPAHFERLTDFWETNLFFVRKFKGNPIQLHKEVDENFKYNISQEHFGRWLQLWFSTVDELFYGEQANQAKERARNIASMLFFKLYESKPK